MCVCVCCAAKDIISVIVWLCVSLFLALGYLLIILARKAFESAFGKLEGCVWISHGLSLRFPLN